MTIYNEAFFSGQRTDSRRSAEQILPIVFDLIQPKSVVDVGCGVGTWLSVTKSLGIEDVLGVDGDYVDSLEIPDENFVSSDISKPFTLGRRFDLAICVEVAEHLPPSSAETLVQSLAGTSDAILFSAAIPEQGGTHHVNEQWPSYWYRIFRKHGMLFYDCLRAQIWENPLVQHWYAQNCFLVLSKSHPLAHAAVDEVPRALVHPHAWVVHRDIGPSGHIKAIPQTAARAIRKRLRRFGQTTLFTRLDRGAR